MNIRGAKIADVEAICSLITRCAELDRMLFRSKSEIYADLQSFKVAEVDGRVVGCGALQIIWSDLAEIKSLAVDGDWAGKGIGRAIVDACIAEARALGVPRVFALTLEPGFFEKGGFSVIEKEKLPMKVWSDCASCSKQDKCDEVAMIMGL